MISWPVACDSFSGMMVYMNFGERIDGTGLIWFKRMRLARDLLAFP